MNGMAYHSPSGCNSHQEMMILIDRTGRVIDTTLAWQRLVRVKREEFSNMLSDDLELKTGICEVLNRELSTFNKTVHLQTDGSKYVVQIVPIQDLTQSIAGALIEFVEQTAG